MTHHPFYPRSLALPHHVANTMSANQLCVIVGTVMSLFMIMAWQMTRHRGMSNTDRSKFVWFALCTALHGGFEAYWIRHHDAVASRLDLAAQLWKEYALSDSRYMTSDPLLLSLETLTVFCLGPLCALTCLLMWWRSPHQYTAQLLTSVGHLTSCILYFAVDAMDGFQHSVPGFRYFWVYFVAFNAPWIVIPCILVYQSITHRHQKPHAD